MKKGEHQCSIGEDVNWWNHYENSMEVPQKIKIRDFPGGPVVKNPPANSGDMGSKLAWGSLHLPQSNKAHAPQLLRASSRAPMPQLLKPTCPESVLSNKGSHHNKKPIHRS